MKAKKTKEKVIPYVVFNGKKYVRGQGLMEYRGQNKKWADNFYK